MTVPSNQLQKTIRLPQAIALYIGSVLGSGILLVPGLAAELAGPASLLSWGIMMILVLPMALVMGWLAALHPHAGGVAHYVGKAFGKRTGTLVGWFFLMSVVIGAPVNALTGANYLATTLGVQGIGVVWIAAGMILFALIMNYYGMKVSGQIQVVLTFGIIFVLFLAIFGSLPHVETKQFQPFSPHGWWSVGQSTAILFWCFIGWEAVSHLSEEFVDPKKDSVKAVTIAAILVGILYFCTAFATVGTGTYKNGAATALIDVIKQTFGASGGILAGVMGFLICMATMITYFGAASRLAYALALDSNAPSFMGRFSVKHATPIGGLIFLTFCFTIVLSLYATELIPLSILIQLPNATFVLTYLFGCAAAIRIFKDFRLGRLFSWVSLVLTACIIPFVGWALFYPVVITVFVLFFLRYKDLRQIKE